jgi:hypothetical protein
MYRNYDTQETRTKGKKEKRKSCPARSLDNGHSSGAGTDVSGSELLLIFEAARIK